MLPVGNNFWRRRQSAFALKSGALASKTHPRTAAMVHAGLHSRDGFAAEDLHSPDTWPLRRQASNGSRA
jgi:hypothetical protein